MSARSELYLAVMDGGYHSPARSERASALIDAFAHELAERQRAEKILPPITEGEVWANRMINRLADLIDPEVSKCP